MTVDLSDNHAHLSEVQLIKAVSFGSDSVGTIPSSAALLLGHLDGVAVFFLHDCRAILPISDVLGLAQKAISINIMFVESLESSSSSFGCLTILSDLSNDFLRHLFKSRFDEGCSGLHSLDLLLGRFPSFKGVGHMSKIIFKIRL